MKKGIFFLMLGAILAAIYYFGKDQIEQVGEYVVEKIESALDAIYQKWAVIRNIDWKLLKAIALVESSENPNAIGAAGEIGLCQIMPAVGSAFGMTREDLLDPDMNVQVESALLSDYLPKYGLEGAIQAYNLGETKWRRGFTSPTYLAKVLQSYESLGGVIV